MTGLAPKGAPNLYDRITRTDTRKRVRLCFCSSALSYRSPGRTGDLFRTHKQKGSGIDVPKPFLLAVGQYLRTDDPTDQNLSFNFSKEQIIYHEAIYYKIIHS